MRQDMATRFDSNEAAGEKLLFFGAFHCKKPNDFAFHIGDKLLIKKLVSVVKSKTQNDDYEHFQLDEKKARESSNRMKQFKHRSAHFSAQISRQTASAQFTLR